MKEVSETEGSQIMGPCAIVMSALLWYLSHFQLTFLFAVDEHNMMRHIKAEMWVN